MINGMRLVLCLSLLLALLVHAPAQADALKGVTAVTLTIAINKTLVDAGVDESSVRNSVELKLRDTGLVILPLFPKKGEAHAKSCVTLVMSADGMRIKDDNLYCFSCRSAVMEYTLMLRPPPVFAAFVLSITWSELQFGYVGTDRVVDGVRKDIDDQANSFCNDYLTANPKPSPVAPAPMPASPPAAPQMQPVH